MENERRDVWVIESVRGWTVDLGVDERRPSCYHVSETGATAAGETLARVLGRHLFLKDRTGKIREITPARISPGKTP